MNVSELIVIAAAASAATAGDAAVFRNRVWYRHLALPSPALPVWFMAAAQTAVLIFAVASALAAAAAIPHRAIFWPITAVFGITLLLNFGWAYIFFARRILRVAGWAAVAGVLSALALIVFIAPFSTLASLLWWPSAAWGFVAAAYSFAVWRLN